ncbi:hypothetical protein PMIN06_000272 [Paraphaeosphaeria minitans]
MPITDRPGENNGGIFVVGDVATGEYCVEKRLTPADIADGHAQREIDIISQLSGHPNIIQLVDYEIEDDAQLQECDRSARTWTEFCEYGSLRNTVDFLHAGDARLSEALLWHILGSLAEAVRYMQQGPKDYPFLPWNTVCHRDIHLGNVFLASEPAGSNFPRVVLGDFGLSTTVAHTLLGYNKEWVVSWFEGFLRPQSSRRTIKSQMSIRLGLSSIVLCMGSIRRILASLRVWCMESADGWSTKYGCASCNLKLHIRTLSWRL